MSILIKNAKHMLTMDDNYKDCNSLLINDGKIIKVGKDLDDNAETIIDATEKWVLPGFIDAHCHMGISEDAIGEDGEDCNEMTDPVTASLRAIDAINPYDRAFKESRDHGITTVCTGPGSANVVGGQFVALKTYGRKVEDMIIKEPLALKAAFGENPKRVYGEQKKSPYTRMATASLLRESLLEAKIYVDKIEKYKDSEDDDKIPDRDLEMESLGMVIRREIPLKIHAHRADDILTAIRIAKEFNIRYTLEHCTEGYLIADILKEENATVIAGPLLCDRSKIELANLSFKSLKVLYDNGLEPALMTDHPVIPSHYLPVCAAIAVREGITEMQALKLITINAAKANFIDDRVGSLTVGKDADILIFDNNPLDFRAKVETVIIDGKKM